MLVSENLLATSEITASTYLIAIYKALGGGWDIITEDDIKTKIELLKQKETSSK